MFWQQIYNSSAQVHTQIQQLITKDDLDGILKLTNVAQEIKHDYQPLIQYLCQPSKMVLLFQYLFQQQATEMQKAASEIITGDNTTIVTQVVNLLCKVGDAQMNQILLDSLQINERFTISVAESVCRFIYAVSKIGNLHAQFCQYLQGPGKDLFEAYINRLGSAPIAESLHYLNKISPDDNKQIIYEFLLYEINIIIRFYDKVTELEFYTHTNFIIQQLFNETTEKQIQVAIFVPLIQILQNLKFQGQSNPDPYAATLEQQRIHNLSILIPICLKQISKSILLSETCMECQQWVQICQQMVAGCKNLLNFSTAYLTFNTMQFLAEVASIPQFVETNIKVKENALVNRSYKPEEAIQYVTDYYKQPSKCPKNQSDLLPLITGFSYIFTDFYPHLIESASPKIFDQNWMKMGEPKDINMWCLMGPNKEVMVGSSVWIVQEIVKQVEWQNLFTLLAQYQQSSIFYCYLVQLYQTLLECRKFCCEFPQDAINMYLLFSKEILDQYQKQFLLKASEMFALQILEITKEYATQDEMQLIQQYQKLQL